MALCADNFRNTTNKNLITVLSIDGGGVRCLIPAVILKKLEKELQDLDGEDAKIANYFDVIAGTGTGGQIAAMLTQPNPKTATSIVDFCKDMFPRIYPQSEDNSVEGVGANNSCNNDGKQEQENNTPRKEADENKEDKQKLGENGTIKKKKSWWGYLQTPKEYIWSPRYARNTLKTTLEEQFGTKDCTTRSLTMEQTIISNLYREIREFDNEGASNDSAINAKLSDICIGGSSTPTYFPSHRFENGGTKFNLIDGGIVYTNPALVAMLELSKELDEQSEGKVPRSIMPMHDKRLLVISLGCGRSKKQDQQNEEQEGYDAEIASKWGHFEWFCNTADGSNPVVDCFFEAGAKVVDYHNKVLFEAIGLKDNYFRIQVDLEKANMPLDLATGKNLNFLEEKGQALLDEEISRVDPELFKGVPHKDNKITNADVLKSMAKRLSDEKKTRIFKTQDD